MSKQEAIASHPDFPWLSADDAYGVAVLLGQLGWLKAGETVAQCARAGEGNMNLTLRVRTDRREFVLKQARPWVEKYDTIAAPWDRVLFEQLFYQRAGEIPGVADHMPALLHADGKTRVLMLEFIPDAHDRSDLYGQARLTENEADTLAGFLAALHTQTAGKPEDALTNRDMRALNAEHIFDFPLNPGNGLDLDGIEPGLRAAADALAGDRAYREAVAELKTRYLADGPCLLQGDFFPGSWLSSADRGILVIDPEFCFFGDPEFDLGVMAGHLAMADQPAALTDRVLKTYRDAGGQAPDPALLARFAAMEIMRRLIGVAQLPLSLPEGERAAMLTRSRDAMLESSLSPLRK